VIELIRQIAESRASAKRLKSEVVALRKQLSKDVKPRTPGLDRNASLPRSPQKRHMNVSDLTTKAGKSVR
jgi:uncharacterized protein YdhG (YjbR/CyaY superfamily)